MNYRLQRPSSETVGFPELRSTKVLEQVELQSQWDSARTRHQYSAIISDKRLHRSLTYQA
jgi:hypothetical protein